MPGAPFQAFLMQMRLRADGGVADAVLLEQFVGGNEAAFEALVRRHGPLVLGVCKRVLGDAHAAEDAFQATFLILVRKAGSVRKHASLGSWLHGVAYRTALKARARAACRRRHEREATPPEQADPARDLTCRDLRAVLDAELDRLPCKYREPLVLCYLEGMTQEAAARQLGWQLGTLATRVLRGRERLRSLLQRRGVALSAAGLAVLTHDSVSAALLGSTVTCAVGPATLTVETLATGVMRSMTYSKVQKVLLAVLAVTLFGAVGLAWQWRQSGVTAAPAQATAPRDKGAPKKDLALLQGEWKLSALEFGDLSLPEERLAGYRYTFAGDKLTWQGPLGVNKAEGKVTVADGTYDCTVKIDPGKQPKQIDITFRFPKGDRTVLGIYDLQGDTLRLCFSGAGRRPAEFSSKDDPRGGNMVLTRVKK